MKTTLNWVGLAVFISFLLALLLVVFLGIIPLKDEINSRGYNEQGKNEATDEEKITSLGLIALATLFGCISLTGLLVFFMYEK